MYDFKREGFPGFPLGQKIEFYGQKLPEPRMVVTDLPGTSRSIRTLHSRLALEGSEHSSIACQLGEDDLVSLIEISWLMAMNSLLRGCLWLSFPPKNSWLS